MATYYVTMLVETGTEDEDTDEVAQTIRDAVGSDGWHVVSLTVAEN